MATAKKNTDIYDEVRCDFYAKLFVKTAYLALLAAALKYFPEIGSFEAYLL